MALAIGVGVGHTIYLNDDPLKIVSAEGKKLTLLFKGVYTTVGIVERVTIAPDVAVFCATSRTGLRLCFDAPKSICILREKLYKERANGCNLCK